MATPRADTYNIASGASLWAGRAPALRSGIQFGDSLMSFGYQADGGRWGLPLTRKQPRVFYNLGVANDTLQNMLDRQSAAIASAALVGADFVLLRAGTNGAGGGDFATKYAQIVDAFVAAGLFVFCHQVPPKTGSDYSSLNTIIQGICASRLLTTKWVQDCDTMAEAGYQPIAGTTTDGIHMSPVGAYLIGTAQAPILEPYFTVDPRVVNSTQAAAQWLTNPLMTGTGGSLSGGTGTVPTGWSVSGIGASFTASIVAADGADPVQVPWLAVELNSAGTAGHSWEISADLVHPAISTDLSVVRSVDCVVEAEFVNLDTTNLTGIEAGPASARVYIQPAPRMQLKGNGTQNRKPVFRSCYERSATAYSANALKLMVNIVAGGAISSSAGTVKLRCASAVGAVNATS